MNSLLWANWIFKEQRLAKIHSALSVAELRLTPIPLVEVYNSVEE